VSHPSPFVNPSSNKQKTTTTFSSPLLSLFLPFVIARTSHSANAPTTTAEKKKKEEEVPEGEEKVHFGPFSLSLLLSCESLSVGY
jgi:hypothetical protein